METSAQISLGDQGWGERTCRQTDGRTPSAFNAPLFYTWKYAKSISNCSSADQQCLLEQFPRENIYLSGLSPGRRHWLGCLMFGGTPAPGIIPLHFANLSERTQIIPMTLSYLGFRLHETKTHTHTHTHPFSLGVVRDERYGNDNWAINVMLKQSRGLHSTSSKYFEF